MSIKVKRSEKLTAVLEQLNGGKNVQNRQLRTLLGEDGYARFCDDWQRQQQLRDMLAEKPRVVVEYQRRLKEATFAYAKVDAASGQGRHNAARKLMAISNSKFDHLIEFLAENFEGQADLLCWLDRAVQLDSSNCPSLCPESFPVVVTSRSLRNEGGGYLAMKRTKRQVKIEAVECALAEQENGNANDAEVMEGLLEKAKRLRRLALD